MDPTIHHPDTPTTPEEPAQDPEVTTPTTPRGAGGGSNLCARHTRTVS